MGRLGLVLALLLWFPGCAVVTTLAAVPGAVIDGVVYLFKGGEESEESLPASMRNSLASVQKGLRSMQLDVDVLELTKEGYLIEFDYKELDGTISLMQQTPKLTTINVKVRRGMSGREESVERAIHDAVRKMSEHVRQNDRFQFDGYNNIREKPNIEAKRIGWYRRGTKIDARKYGTKGWMKIKLPSGKSAYLKRDPSARVQKK